MVLFTILLFTLIFIIGFGVILLAAGGSLAIIALSDVIVCVAIIVMIMRLIIHKKRG